MEFIGDVARKFGPGDLLEIEASKADLGRKIGERTRLFYVPKNIRLDKDEGVLETEYLAGLVTLQVAAVRRDKRLLEYMEKAGRALAVIHQHLVLPDKQKHLLPPTWMGTASDHVFIHGDYVCINVGWDESRDQLVVIDWAAAPAIDKTATYGSRYFDILCFLEALFRGIPKSMFFHWDTERMAAAFLSGYRDQAAIVMLDGCREYASNIYRLQRKYVWGEAKRKPLLKAMGYLVAQMIMSFRLRWFIQRA